MSYRVCLWTVSLLLAFTGGVLPAAAQTRPRIWLTPTGVQALRAKSAGDADWASVKAAADQLVAQSMPRFTVLSATNTNPVQITLQETVPFSGTVSVFLSGGTGAWVGLNERGGDRPTAVAATRTSTNTFTVPVDASAFGSFAGQHIVVFFPEGNYSRYGYQGSDWQSTLQTLGLAYQITGTATYATKGIELLTYIASLGQAGMLAPVAIDSGYPSRSAIVAMAIAYDWFYDRLAPAQKTAVVTALNLWYDWFKRSAFERDGPGYGNYFGGHVMGFGMAGLATGTDNPRGGEIASYVRSLFDSHVRPAFESGGFAGGFPVEGYVYGANHFVRLLSYMLAVRTATGENLFATTDYAQKVARNLIHNLKPNRWQVGDEANYAGDYTGVLQPSVPLLLAHILAGTEEGGRMQWLYRNITTSPHGGQFSDPFARFLYDDSSRAALDYRSSAPTWHYSSGDHHLYRRSSWQDGAVWTSMMGGTAVWAGHQMRAAGHVAIQRGSDYLLVNSGQWKGSSGVTGSPQVFDARAWRTNTLFVNDGGEYLFTGTSYVGGQGYWGTNTVLAQEGRSEFGYLKADLTTAYAINDASRWDNRSVRHFRRSFVSLGSGIVVLFDRIEVRRNTYTKALYFHFNPNGGVPAIAGDTVTSRVGSSALFLKTLLPAAPSLRVVPDPVSDTDSRTSTYRVELSDSVSGTTLNALNVMVAAASNATTPAIARVQSSGNTMVGALVADGGADRVVMFANDGSAQAGVVYNAAIAAGRSASHVLVDMSPGATFQVLLNGTALTSVTASGQGVISFQSTGGGQFELRLTSAGAVPSAPSNVRFVTATPPTPPVISSFSAAPATLSAAGVATLSWAVSGANTVEISGGIGLVSGSSIQVPVTSTQTFTLTARNLAGAVSASATVVVGQNPSSSGGRYVAMIAPVAGESFTAPSSLRLVAAGRDPNVFTNHPGPGRGGNAASVQFFVDDQFVLEVDGSQAEYWVFKGFVQNVAPGLRRVWARAIYSNPTLVLDSEPVMVNVTAAPAYAQTINLNADLVISSNYQLSGTATSRVRINGNGYRIVTAPGATPSITFRYVDFFDIGNRGSTETSGIAVAVGGALVVENCTFDGSNPVEIRFSGSATASITGNTFRSNMRQPLGQQPDGGSGPSTGSYPVAVFKGVSSGTKQVRGNNVGAGWLQFEATSNWIVGGDSNSDSNVLMGPRIGLLVDRLSSNISIRRNFSYHIYYGGWSQGNNFELGGVPTVTAQHNVIVGSSWPVRGVGGEFSYNLVLQAGHQWLWADNSGAWIHHNVFVGGDNDVGGIFGIYNPQNVRIENNTFDGLNGSFMAAAVKLNDGAISLRSNLFLNTPRTPVSVGASSLSADYNLFWNTTTSAYSDGRRPAHDVNANPLLASPPGVSIDFDTSLIWSRSLGVGNILPSYRSKYTPLAGSPALTGGDPLGGAGNFIGAVGGASALPADRFGK